MANFLPKIINTKYPVATCDMASNTQPRPSSYAIPGPPMKLLALPYVAVIVIAKTNPPRLRLPRKYSCKKELEEATVLPAQTPIIKMMTKNPINGITASQFIIPAPHHQMGLQQTIWTQ